MGSGIRERGAKVGMRMQGLAGKLHLASGALDYASGSVDSGRQGLDFQVHAGDLSGAVAALVSRALAQLGKADVPGLAELDSSGNENAVDIDAGLALELKEQVDGAGVGGAAAQDPSAACEDGASEGADKARRVNLGDCFHLQGPWSWRCLYVRRVGHLWNLTLGFIGGRRGTMTVVAESNG